MAGSLRGSGPAANGGCIGCQDCRVDRSRAKDNPPLTPGWRALLEADINRLKRVIGGGLRLPTDLCRATEVAIAVSALTGMPELGRPE